MKFYSQILVVPVALGLLFSAGCAKKKVAAAPPPTPAPTTTASRTTDSSSTAARNNTTPQTTTSPAARSNYPDKATRDRIDTLLARISDAYFDYDKHTLRPDAVQTLAADSKELRDIL